MTMIGTKNNEQGPVFIAGPERSGTSLIYALLASHPNIAMTRRTNMWTHFYKQFGDLSNPENFERCLMMMMRYKRLIKLNPDPDRIQREFWQGRPTYGRLFELLENHFAEEMGKPRWGDKSLNTERYTDEIFQAYRNASIIHMIRDPRDRYSSSQTRWNVNRGGIGAGTGIWLNTISFADRYLKRYPDRYMTVRYEDLAGDPEGTLKKICTFIGESYSPDMLTMDGAMAFREQGGNSSYSQRKPGKISTSSIGKFRDVLTKYQVVFMQIFSKRTMLKYGYELEKVDFSILDWFRFFLLDIPFNLARMVAWLVREAVLNGLGRDLPPDRLVSEEEAVRVKAT